ncbi:uncharacterized protein LOC128554661 [Mercenaria mercenaria]|uniref:uncharacterized protein LOC128554661 n=1 Tax=Mercenaria mercenaria TaxID=6596 RepID=UPI00234E9F39|nr:uncharacterized protein LOC128554661 [Mercenaria mercenaria]
MEITEYNVPEWCFPRYQYSMKIKKDLAKRYNNLMRRLQRDVEPLEGKNDFPDNKICIFLCKDLSFEDIIPSIQSVVSRKCDNITKENTSTIDSLNDLLSKGHFKRNTFVITNSKSDILKSIKDFKEYVIVIANDEKDVHGLLRTFKHYEHAAVCTVENICDVVSTRLERYAFTGMKNACAYLDSILTKRNLEHHSTQHDDKASVIDETTEKEEDDYIQTEVVIKRAQSAKENSKTTTQSIPKRSMSANENSKSGRHIPVENSQNIGTETRDTTSLSRNRFKTVKKREKCDNSKPQKSIAVLSKEHIESIERLYDEIVGIFNRSNLPETEFPNLRYKMNNKIDEKLLIKLQQMSDVIQSCGYRFSTFQVYTKDGLCSEDLNKNIKALLEEHGITEYSIVSSDINTFSTCHVGKKIAVKDMNDRKIYGTLGGFAHTSSGESERTWALISRHVANCSSDRNLYVENGKERVVAKIMKQIHEGETEKQYLDIAAACLENDAETGYDTRYITEENIIVQGKLCNYDTKKTSRLTCTYQRCFNTTGTRYCNYSRTKFSPKLRFGRKLYCCRRQRGKWCILQGR